ncbi:cold shock domain-containing protein [Streptomyces sp. NPDC005283]|uniref:cold-shock protein n=1 Tax=unclassified Streptomyces TaxID=2593676 RepID=UPI003454A5C4
MSFDSVRGYGFVSHPSGEDAFMHANDILCDRYLIAPGMPVQFEDTESERGLKAVNVRLLEQMPSAEADGAHPAGPATDSTAGMTTSAELLQEFTDVIISEAPSVTAAQISQLRQRLLATARSHGWVHD